ncbi:MAG: tetratricopeptide repeat protein [Thermotogales bacterium]|nr:tetratricopeptide repeat protein [Thermotogales bacterium]
MSLLMDALRRAETHEQEEQADTDSITESATNPADLKLEPLNAGAELVEELRTETDALAGDTLTESTESPDTSLPQDQARTAAALVATPATAWQKKALFFLSGFVTILTIIGGYYLWRSDQTTISATTHSATLIDTPSSDSHSEPAIELLPTPAASTGNADKASVLPAAPVTAPTNQPNVEAVRATSTRDTSVTQPDYRIEIHKSRKSRSVHPLILKAYGAYQQQDYTEAEQLYRKALKRYPNNRDAALGLAAIAMHQGNRKTARYYYQRVLKANPADKTAQIALGSLDNTQDNLQETSQLKYWLQDDRNNAQLHFALGNRYASAGQWKEAQRAYFEALRIDPGQPDYAFNLAVSLDQLGLQKQALEYYLNARQLAGNHTALFNAGQLEKRIRQLEQGQGITP